MPMANAIVSKSKHPLFHVFIGADPSRQFGSLSEKVQEYEALLRDLSSRVGDEDAENIKRALEKVGFKNTQVAFNKA